MFSLNDLKESNDFLNVLVDNLVSAVFIVDKNIRVQSFNDSFKALFHKPEEQILGELCGNALGCSYVINEGKDCGSTSNCGACMLRNSLVKAFSLKVPAFKERLTRKFYIDEKEVLKYFMYTSKYVVFNGEEMVLVLVDDITELMTANLELKKMAVTDGLTELYNHKHIYFKLEEEISRARRYGTTLSLLMMDIDYFKRINDNYGHQTGDKTLIAVGKLIRDIIRDVDYAGRYGGEEFMIILPQTQLKNACATAERIRKKVESHHFEEIKEPVTLCVGTAELILETEKPETALKLIDRADKLLYQAKQAGRNRVRF
jgi:diguanylate cyclase (GGDEF)-like protein